MRDWFPVLLPPITAPRPPPPCPPTAPRPHCTAVRNAATPRHPEASGRVRPCTHPRPGGKTALGLGACSGLVDRSAPHASRNSPNTAHRGAAEHVSGSFVTSSSSKDRRRRDACERGRRRPKPRGPSAWALPASGWVAFCGGGSRASRVFTSTPAPPTGCQGHLPRWGNRKRHQTLPSGRRWGWAGPVALAAEGSLGLQAAQKRLWLPEARPLRPGGPNPPRAVTARDLLGAEGEAGKRSSVGTGQCPTPGASCVWPRLPCAVATGAGRSAAAAAKPCVPGPLLLVSPTPGTVPARPRPERKMPPS